MRVLVFTDEYDLGYYTFIYNEIEMLGKAGIEVFVVCERVGKLAAGDDNYTCISLTKNKILRSIYLAANRRRLFFIIFLYPYLRKRNSIIKKFKPDLVHFHFGDTAARFYFPLKRTLKNFPFLVSFHGFDASSQLNKPHYLESLRRLVKQPGFYAICVSQHLRNNLLARGLDINDQNSAVLYYGINVQRFSRTRTENNTVRVFLQISAHYEKKGLIYTLKAFKKFLGRNRGKARLIIGGDGPMRGEIMEACKDLDLCNEVEFPGWLSREQASTLLDGADYFVHHSITASNGDQEGLPNAIIEAMAMELPVISTFHSGIPELIEDGVNGYLVQEKDIDTYALRMEQILSWSYLKTNEKKVNDKFSLQEHTKSLISIYQHIISKQAK